MERSWRNFWNEVRAVSASLGWMVVVSELGSGTHGCVIVRGASVGPNLGRVKRSKNIDIVFAENFPFKSTLKIWNVSLLKMSATFLASFRFWVLLWSLDSVPLLFWNPIQPVSQKQYELLDLCVLQQLCRNQRGWILLHGLLEMDHEWQEGALWGRNARSAEFALFSSIQYLLHEYIPGEENEKINNNKKKHTFLLLYCTPHSEMTRKSQLRQRLCLSLWCEISTL